MGKTIMNYLMGERAHVVVSDGVFFVKTPFSLHLPKAYDFSSPEKFMSNFGMPVEASAEFGISAAVSACADVRFEQSYLRVDGDVSMARYISASGKTLWINPLLLPSGEVSIYSEDESSTKAGFCNSVRVFDANDRLVAIIARLAPAECEEWMNR